MPDAVQIVEVPSMRLLFTNRHGPAITEAHLGRPATLDVLEFEGEVLHPDGTEFARDDWPIMRAARGEKVSDEEVVYALPDGRSMTFMISAAPVLDSDGKVVTAVAVGRDVTEQEDADSASLGQGL